jgi:hypothetical protein
MLPTSDLFVRSLLADKHRDPGGEMAKVVNWAHGAMIGARETCVAELSRVAQQDYNRTRP